MKYSTIQKARNGSDIPLFNNISFHSKYNPEKEAEGFVSQFSEGKESNFFIVLGLCGGYHISALSKKFPNAKIIAIEETKEDIEFLEQIEEIKNLKKNENIIFSSLSDLNENLIQTYKPQIHGNLTITALRQWENTFSQTAEKAKELFQESIKQISADFSVQSHFGKIWQKNIFENLKTASEISINIEEIIKNFPKEKTAAIIAAGPSFDETYRELTENRDNYVIFSTDTAYTSLADRNIFPDVVVSVDGQIISYAHYFNKVNPKTLFLFDLCANSSSVRKIRKSGAKIIFSEANHPLAQWASSYKGKKSFPHVETGSGTVTIAAASFASLCGFKKLKFFGADFSYLNGKSYTKNTYLDTLYRKDETRLQNSESLFDKLLFRTELKKLSKKHYTTEILESYQDSLVDFLRVNEFFEESENFFIKKTKNADKKTEIPYEPFDFRDFSKQYAKSLKESFKDEKSLNEKDPAILTLLPFCAWIENHKKFSRFSYTEFSIMIAYRESLRYTESL